MNDLSITDFKIGNELLSSLGYMICSFNGADNDTVSIGNNLEFNYVQPALSDKSYIIGSKYSENLSRTFQICKAPDCNGSKDIKPITPEDMNIILGYLGRRQSNWVTFYGAGNEEPLKYYGNFNGFNAVLVGGTPLGIEFTFVSTSPYGYGETVIVDFQTDGKSATTVVNTSNEIGILLPKIVKITSLISGNISLISNFENRKTEILDCKKNEEISLYCQQKIIKSSLRSDTEIANNFNYNYPRLVRQYKSATENFTNNPFTTNIACKIHIEYDPVRKVGIC